MAGKTTKKSPFDCAAFYTITSKLSGKAVTACGESEVRMFAPTVETGCGRYRRIPLDF